METTRIPLTLNREEREVEASIFIGATQTYLIVHGIALTTTQGQRTHRGYIWLNLQEQGHPYSPQDIVDIGYSGMRGNGHAQRSRFRHIGFFPAD